MPTTLTGAIITILITWTLTALFLRGCGYGLTKSKTNVAEEVVRVRTKKGATLTPIRSINPKNTKNR